LCVRNLWLILSPSGFLAFLLPLGVLALPYDGAQGPLVAHSHVVGHEYANVEAYFSFEDQESAGVKVTVDVRSGLTNTSMVRIPLQFSIGQG
jgi:hypothetical protein